MIKKIQSIDSTETYTCDKERPNIKKEEIKSNNIIKQYKND